VSHASPKNSLMSRLLSSVSAPKAQQEIEDAKSQVRAAGATPIVDCSGGSRSTVCGVLKSVSLRPRAGVPALEADLFDGSGQLRLVFLGRRSIAGIEPGRRLTATGRVNCRDDQAIMFNPRYQLLPSRDED
jgi:hypothetical protein